LKSGAIKGTIKGTELDEAEFLEEQFFAAKHALFAATTVREIRFLQNKINYLRQQMTNLQKKEKVKNKTNKKSEAGRGKKAKIRAKIQAKIKAKKQAKIRGKKPKFVRYAREDKYQPKAML